MEPSSPLAQPDATFGAHGAPLPDRVNAEPAIIRGLSSTESVWVIGLAFLLWFPVSGVLGFAFRSLPMAVFVIVTGPLATAWLVSGQMATVKRNRPDYYYIHLALHRFASMHLIRSPFVTHSGAWEIGRTLPPVQDRKARRRPLL
ncbi:TIGR03750 family conjugal transfer protein [Aromatoleum anaerobium]|uniref:TIGR03750 family conjugal transfer protein n=2 Tax=Aromatoleum TaxID=551759 RepID=A0ABX1PUW9_9RHOO|nr:TIGR03750 family conjugal transfer protein [Aromatoleum anaerobium]MCK0508628.1 TIGR03750 family conjugal transfer protein [Aromatoleum anaerobium]